MRQPLATPYSAQGVKTRLGTALAVLAAVALNIAVSQAQARTPIVDGDADGVDDAVDQCLYTLPQAVVDARGCSAQSDQDGDGVRDDVDDCPYTSAGAEVDARGCAIDDDFDGVANGLDACADSQLGALVDDRGCGIGQLAQAIKPRPRAISPVATTSVRSAAPLNRPVGGPMVQSPELARAPTSVGSSTPLPVPSPQPRAPVRIVIPAPVVTAAAVAGRAAQPAAPKPANLLSLSFAPHRNTVGAGSMARLSKALPALREALAARSQAVLLVEGYADTESDGDAADTLARSRANTLRRLLEQQGIDSKRLRSVGHRAVEAGAEFRRADVVLETE